MRERSSGFWLWYGLAWAPPLAIYFFAFRLQGRLESWDAMLLASGASVLPEALLGVCVVWGCQRAWRSLSVGERAARIALHAAWFVPAATWLKATLAIAVSRRAGHELSWDTYDRGLLLWQAFLCALSFTVIASVTYGRATALRLRAEAARRAEAELLRARSELKALRARLEPHFLFNTLHSVQALVRDQPAAAEEALVGLGDLLRYVLSSQDLAEDGVLLREEWHFVRAYLELEKLRLGDRLRVVEHADEAALDCVVPAFVLQPLVENAIRHALAPRPSGGTLELGARVVADTLELTVRDDGDGAPAGATRGSGQGLDLVRRRLHAFHGDAGTLTIDARAGAGFTVVVRLPAGATAE
jgi:signal transduction histidine kinase